MSHESGLIVLVDNVIKTLEAITELASHNVMVGIPDEKAGRREGAISNAALGYIHENGAPEANIPARPFLLPGVKSVQTELNEGFKKAGELALDGKKEGVMRQFHRIGLLAQNAVRKKISEGIPPPLAPSTIKGRMRRIKGKARKAKIDAAIAAGTPFSKQGGAEGIFTPLLVTGQLRNAITYVIRAVGGGHHH